LKSLLREQIDNPNKITSVFFSYLKTELTSGNPHLSEEEQERLRSHYPYVMDSYRYPAELVAIIYSIRRAYPTKALLESETPLVLDAGCGYGSDSILFAALGAKVLAVDTSPEHIEIAEKRKRYYEETLEKSLDITFEMADLNEYTPNRADISLTWLSSVLAVIADQDTFLSRLYRATRGSGKIMIVDYNLWNPHVLWTEWRRRRQALSKSPEFARHADFWGMVNRKNRLGAMFFPRSEGGFFDDVQFFSPRSLGRLLERVGFRLSPSCFSGFAPPFLFNGLSAQVERAFSQVPIIKNLGRANLVTAVK